MNKALKLETYTDEELETLILCIIGTFIRPLPYKGRHLASCGHYIKSCTLCPLNTRPELCDTVYPNKSDDIENCINSVNKLFPCNFIENHPEYFI